jgi:hypothetical protein
MDQSKSHDTQDALIETQSDAYLATGAVEE